MRYISTTFGSLVDTYGELTVGLTTTAIAMAVALIVWYLMVGRREGALATSDASDKSGGGQ